MEDLSVKVSTKTKTEDNTMKKFLSMILAFVLMFTLVACGADNGVDNGTDNGATDGAESWAEDWGVRLSVKNVTSSGLTLICEQSGGIAEGSLETGSAYVIEKFENNIWVEVQPQGDAVWNMLSYLIGNTTTEWEIDWTWLYGELSAGTYRIGKTVMEFKESGASRSQIFFAEFEIKG